MKRIALLVNSLQGGGAERCAADLSIVFSNRGYEVYIFTDLSIPVKYEYKGVLINFSFDDSLIKKIEKCTDLKKEYNIDISISFLQTANFINILSKNSEKVVLTNHSIISEYASYERGIVWDEKLFPKLFQYADIITFPSEYCRQDWIEHYGDENKITKTIYNPVHLMDSALSGEKENIIITIGRMHPVKRQWILLRVFKQVLQSVPDAKLIILGDGELRNQIEAQVSELRIEEHVMMPGSVENVGDYLAKAKVFTLTSRCEAMPCSVLEAISAKIPIVAMDIPGGIREEVGVDGDFKEKNYPLNGICGLLTEYSYTDNEDTESKLADQLIRVLKDLELERSFIDYDSEHIKKFLPDTIGKIWIEEIFESLFSSDSTLLGSKIKGFKEIRKTIIEKTVEKRGEELYVSYYRILDKWMLLKEKKGSVKTYFEKNKYKRIIIYGFGKMANHLLADLQDSDITIVAAIDRAAVNKYGEFPIISPNEKIPYADCIVITTTYLFQEIYEDLTTKTDIEIISLNEVVQGAF